uniref:E-selectin n=1 Tax=Denticeps clupeoides TaxID=299321 RepID=A0AAY4CAR5_9TELE
MSCGSMDSRCLVFGIFFTIFALQTEVKGWSYHYSDDRMDWESARAWCKSSFTDMVAIQNKEEINHLNTILPKKDGYFWIGIRKITGQWTWVGTNKTLTAEASNWATGEPNNVRSRNDKEDCVEIYIKRTVDEGKWNDISCMKQKTALCYTASCQVDSCSGHGQCVETINNHSCECFEGFYGEGCQHAVRCNEHEAGAPEHGSSKCSHPNGDFSYNSGCRYSCEEGYVVRGSETLTCTASAAWSGLPPACEVVRCPALSEPDKGSVSCSSPLGDSAFLSTCQFTCVDGYVLTGSSTLSCGPAGQWNGAPPHCEAVRCPVLQTPHSASLFCTGDSEFSFGSSCSYTCNDGFRLKGAALVHCLAHGQWSDEPPQCEVVTCPRPESPHLTSQCTDSSSELSISTSCTFTCNAGFVLQGEPRAVCTSTGEWSSGPPACIDAQCPLLAAPESGRVVCSNYDKGSVCTFSCNEGFDLKGAQMAKCTENAEWEVEGDTPTCTEVTCPRLETLVNGFLSCSPSGNAHTFGSSCTFHCDSGYVLHGHDTVTCNHHGNWTAGQPKCQASENFISPTAIGVTAGGATALSGLSLVAWLLKRLRQKGKMFDLNSNSDIEIPPQVYRNSTNSLI